ncbi:hypothetical protein CR513_32684, partial [Mucuna pruriens]
MGDDLEKIRVKKELKRREEKGKEKEKIGEKTRTTPQLAGLHHISIFYDPCLMRVPTLRKRGNHSVTKPSSKKPPSFHPQHYQDQLPLS